MSAVTTIAGYALRESLRRRVFLVVLLLTAAFLGLYALAVSQAFNRTEPFEGAKTVFDAKVLTGATLVGLAMFATLFLGTVLAVFLTLGAVRGDAESGLLQPLVVRPIGRPALLAGRFAGAAAVCAAYVGGVYAIAVLMTGTIGEWWPAHAIVPGLALVAAVTIIVAISLLGSVFLSATANGIAVFMAFGAGLVGGLLGQIGHALNSGTLESIGKAASWVFPFDALYEAGLHELTTGIHGFTGVAVKLGPFGGAQSFGPLLPPAALLYVAVVAAAAVRGFRRTDL